MPELLEQAITRLKSMPANEQEAIAEMIIEELEDETQWDATFAHTQDVLDELAAKAMAEYHAGNT